jgi:hypothetical protein
MSHSIRACEALEPRRLLSTDAAAEFVEPDLPLAGDTSDVVVADAREQIYPPLAPAMWMDESVGSFEEPAEITVAFFGRDPVDDMPARDETAEQPAAPPTVDAGSSPMGGVARPASIAREILDPDQDASLTA